MKKWEYMVLDLVFCDSGYEHGMSEGNTEELLDDQGKRGWELVSVSGRRAFLKRELKAKKSRG